MRKEREVKVSAGDLGKKDEESNEIDISLIFAKISSQNPFPPFRKILPQLFVRRRKFLLVPLSLCEQSLLDIALFSPSSHSSLPRYYPLSSSILSSLFLDTILSLLSLGKMTTNRRTTRWSSGHSNTTQYNFFIPLILSP